MESLMVIPSITKDSLYDMHYERMSKQEAMERSRYEQEYIMRQSGAVRYDYRTMAYSPYVWDDRTDDRLKRENDKLKAELHATKKAAEVQKAQRVKSRESLIAHYYSMRPAGVKVTA